MASKSPGTGSRTLLAGLLLTAVWGVYAQLTKPLLNVDRRKSYAPREDESAETSPVFSSQATKWFPEDPWVEAARGKFRDGSRILYFEDHQLFNENRSVRVKPIALLWQDSTEDDKAPITATADSAQMDTEGKFNFGEGNFGPITSGLLAGDVRITGPDGLRIEGRNFYISEGSMKIWTGLPVRFAWGTHSGTAEAGAEIELLAAADAKQPGLMSVSDVRRIGLLGRVRCNLAFTDEEKDREPILLTVNAANGFEFFVPTREASFMGFGDRKPQRDNQILIERPMPNGAKDLLYCSRLVLQLQPRIREAQNARSGSLELTKIVAEGYPAYFSSREDDVETLHAQMRLMTYDIAGRTLELIDGITASTGRPIPVHVHQGGRKLTTNRVVASLTDDNKIKSIECLGRGEIGESDRVLADNEEAEKQAFDASWNQSLVITQGEIPRVTVSGDVKLSQAATELSLAGDTIDMLLTRQKPSTTVVKSLSDDTEQTNPQAQSIDLSGLKPQQLTVTGNVQMVGRELSGQAREKLTVLFQEVSQIPEEQSDDRSAVRSVSQSTEADSDDSKMAANPSDPKLNGRTTFVSDTIEAVALVPESGKTVFRDVWMKGEIQVSHSSVKQEQSFVAAGNVLYAKNGFNGDREINLYGDPASIVRSADMSDRIEGEQIDLKGRSVSVKGSGRIRFLVPNGLDGRPLEKPSFLDIYWGDHMKFSGRTAHFVGSIRAVMNNKVDHDLQLTCAALKVHFTDPVALEKSGDGEAYQIADSTDSSSPIGQIERIECESKVVVKIDMMEKGVVVAHHHADFTDLVFNQLTGEFHATGPGFVESTFPDKGRGQKITTSQRAIARANIPSKADVNNFVFIHARFIGELRGNQKQSFVQLKQHVRGVFGPVREITDRISIDRLGVDELPENTGSLGCENLSISEIPGIDPATRSFSLVAECNSSEKGLGTRSPCRLESKMISGDADRITYDHSKQQFILKAEEGRQATVSHRSNKGQRGSFVGRQFAYYVDTNELIANQITGVQQGN